MNILSIGTDRTIFATGSAARMRMIEYGSLSDAFHIIVFSKRSLHLKIQQIASNVWIYPTNSLTRFQYMRDAKQVAKQIISMHSLTPENTLVTAQDPFETGLVGYHLKKRFNFKLQLQVHTDVCNLHFMNHTFINMIRVHIAKKTLPYANQIRVVSKKIKDSLIRELGILDHKIDILPIYIRNSPYGEKTGEVKGTDFHKKYPHFSEIILMVGRLESEKNVQLALNVFSEVHAHFMQVGLIIVGSGSEEKKLKRKARSLGLEKSVIFEPWNNSLDSIYSSSDIFLHTSLYEGYGMVFIEAARAGLPIVTSDVGIASEMFENNVSALIAPVNKKDVFIKNVSRLLSDKELRITMGMKGKDVVRKREITKEEYLKKYNHLLEKAFTS